MAEKSIGALWAKSGKSGDYFTGNIEINGEKIAIVAFYNANKKNPKEPDYRILKSVPRPTTEAEDRAFDKKFDEEAEINPDDIPF